MIQDFLQYLFDGLSTGAIYSLLALGLVIVYRGTGHLNFAQGEMAMLSAFMAWWLSDNWLPIWLAVFACAIFAFVLGAVVERVIIRPIAKRSVFAVGVAAIGLLLGINALAPFMWKVAHPEAIGSLFPKDPSNFVTIGGAHWRYENIGVLVVMLVVAGLLFLLFQKTKLGLAMRAVASNPESAPLAGIKTGQVLMMSWGLAAAVGAIGGVMVASLRGNVDSSMMLAIFFRPRPRRCSGIRQPRRRGRRRLGPRHHREHGRRLPARHHRSGAEGFTQPRDHPDRLVVPAVGIVRLQTS